MPRVNTATRPTQRKVTACIHVSKLLAAMFLIGMLARLSPITATTAPVTTGGISRSIPARVPTELVRPIGADDAIVDACRRR